MTTMSSTKASQAELLERVRTALEEFKLPEVTRALEHEIGRQGGENDSRLAMLWRIFEPQLITRRERSATRRLKQAHFPRKDTLDGFDFNFQPDLDRHRIMELATLEFVRRGENLLLAGMSGTGKSHIAIALGRLACAHGLRTRYTTSAEMLTKLHSALGTDTLDQTLAHYVRPELLIIDEVGLDRVERHTLPDAQLFYKVVRPRHEDGRSSVITSNIDWESWGDYLGDQVASVAILDRLIEHGHLITINGPSYRAARHKKLNRRSNKDPAAGPHKKAASSSKKNRSPRSTASAKEHQR